MEEKIHRTIVFPIGEKEYHQIVDNKPLYRKKLSALLEKYPEIFPAQIVGGFVFIGYSKNEIKLPIRRRIIRLKNPFNSYEDYLLHPCFVLPYLKGYTKDVSKGLRLRKYNLPYHVIASTFGRNAMYWYEAEVALSQYNIVGTTVKNHSILPQNILIDEHHTKLFRDKIYVCTTVGGNCFLGASISPTMAYENLRKAYGHFKAEAQQIHPDYCPFSINIDGFQSTKKAIENLFAEAGILRCFLHSFLKIRNCGTKAYDLYFEQVASRVWHCYYAENKRSFAQRISHLERWTKQVVPNSPFKQAILKLCKKKEFILHYDYPDGLRTSNMLDRLMKYQDRRLYSTQNFHGTLLSAQAAIRAHALLINFCPFSPQTINKKEDIHSPFEELNGFRYRENWLENLLVAASLGGNRLLL